MLSEASFPSKVLNLSSNEAINFSSSLIIFVACSSVFSLCCCSCTSFFAKAIQSCFSSPLLGFLSTSWNKLTICLSINSPYSSSFWGGSRSLHLPSSKFNSLLFELLDSFLEFELVLSPLLYIPNTAIKAFSLSFSFCSSDNFLSMTWASSLTTSSSFSVFFL